MIDKNEGARMRGEMTAYFGSGNAQANDVIRQGTQSHCNTAMRKPACEIMIQKYQMASSQPAAAKTVQECDLNMCCSCASRSMVRSGCVARIRLALMTISTLWGVCCSTVGLILLRHC